MALFPRRRYFFCSYCGTFEFIDPEALEGLRTLGASDPPLPCPLCGGALAHGLLDGSFPVVHCLKCRGALMSRAVFTKVVDARRSSAKGPGKIPAPLDPAELRRTVDCPRCRQKMEVHPYYGPGAVVIDTCIRCDAIWLDSGELGQITDAPGVDRAGR
jgi:Zn-finger nucleic acid-binding protein